jgi:hypothetical protein
LTESKGEPSQNVSMIPKALAMTVVSACRAHEVAFRYGLLVRRRIRRSFVRLTLMLRTAKNVSRRTTHAVCLSRSGRMTNVLRAAKSRPLVAAASTRRQQRRPVLEPALKFYGSNASMVASDPPPFPAVFEWTVCTLFHGGIYSF